MTEYKELLKNKFSYLSKESIDTILSESVYMEFEQDAQLLRVGQYIKVIPIVISGVIKVFTSYKDKELLLYYIQPFESCIMSFTSGLANKPSKIFAVTEQATVALLLPVEKVVKWTKQFPDINQLFFKQYHVRYSDLLDTINHLLFDTLDIRVLNYLSEKSKISNEKIIKITHRQIASELGTAREVISRIINKLEKENKVIQHQDKIEIV